MASALEAPRRRPQLREALLLLGFVVVLALALVTVVMPELSREPDTANGTRPSKATAADAEAPARSD